ncbi:V-type proton ATPase 116 kDa subunit a 1 isoform X4 [Acipenser ruthenus]|uniref:V-type proton ATPase 116 kDa subunit a 1 isoform X4 n=1 Tax=Acipenser ruthenus TaxID=7906 RepID=UPI0027419F28|nr:V-type proton ATPase 116 kDa subunit a 1 isoform X4 [Acipenser ruthenus]
MNSFLRSEEMCLVQLFFQTETAYSCICELGELGLVQFKDLNPGTVAFQRKFVKEVKRCEEMERILWFLEKEITNSNIPIMDGRGNGKAPCPRDVLEMEAVFEKLEKELKEINSNHEVLKQNFTEMMEIKYLLQITEDFFEEAESQLSSSELPSHDSESMAASLRQTSRRTSSVSAGGSLKLGFVAGVIKQERFPAFERVLWRVCHGNFVLRHVKIQAPLEDHVAGEFVKKDVFIIFLQGEEFKGKIRKICEGFHATMYPCPASLYARMEMRTQVKLCIEDLNMEQNGSSLGPILNRIKTEQTPPTFNRTNAFTSGFQSIIDAYGVGNYQEINPAPYSIVTFPFLFAVMFGDCGHGLIMTLFAMWMVTQEQQFKKLKNELIDTIFNGRYIVLLMGIFSVYTGFIYNDCFSKTFNIFGSAWNVKAMFKPNGPWSNHSLHDSAVLQLDPAVPGVFSGYPYPFGIDPIWNIASNKLTFLNSYKMKMSVIVGVLHMLFGVILSLVNYIYFKNTCNIFLQFIPEIVFMVCLFGYLVFLIIYKWCIVTVDESETAPSILLLFINMLLFTYDEPTDTFLYKRQRGVQTFLVVTALLMVPWMLFIKPLLLYKEQKNTKQLQVNGSPNKLSFCHNSDQSDQEMVEVNGAPSSSHCEEEKVNLGDMCVYQAIHTIEYCLGCISNTASYLRLWALSLAHAELSEVLWKMVLQVAFTAGNHLESVVLAVIFAAFAVLTVAILLIMEGLSAFLHALRLHWVEFQNKFYKGSGYKFTPFSFGNLPCKEQ